MSQLVFTQDGHLTEEAKRICIQQSINPDSIKPKTIDNFKQMIKDETIAQIRYKHYQDKRKGKLKQIIEAIKRGDHLQEPNMAFNNQSLAAPYSTAGEAYRSKSQKNNYFLSESSYRRVDIPLREPLDEDFKLNRKLAKQIYEKERKEKVLKNKMDLQEEMKFRQKKIDEKNEKAAKILKEQDQIVKAQSQMQKIKQDERIKTVIDKNKNIQKSLAKEREEKEAELQLKTRKEKEIKEKRRLAEQEKRLQMDIKNFNRERDLKGDSHLKTLQLQRATQQQLEEIEIQLIVKEQKKLAQNLEKSRRAQRHTENCMNVYQKAKENSDDFDEHLLKKLDDKLKEAQDAKMKNYIPGTLNQLAKMDEVQQRKRAIEENEKKKIKELQARNKQRDALIDEVKSAIQEDIEQKKEISMLRKKDQEENYRRGQNFHNMHKQWLVDKIVEKQQRADTLKEQQQRIAAMCSSQRNNLQMFTENPQQIA